MNSAYRGGRRQSWTALFILLTGLCSVHSQYGDSPPRYNYDTLPETRFTCEGKLTGGYYADPETDCQLFHVCAKMSRREVTDYKFLCPNGTVFDQEHQVCADYYQVVCHPNTGTGSNPLGQNFEIFKLSSKESTSRREFGNVPVRDPDYLGQNSLGEEFQAAENNNNGLAASRNSIQYQPSTKSQSRKESIFYQPTTTRRTTTQPPTTTERVTRPPPPPNTTERVARPPPTTERVTRPPPPPTTTERATRPPPPPTTTERATRPPPPPTTTERATRSQTQPTITVTQRETVETGTPDYESRSRSTPRYPFQAIAYKTQPTQRPVSQTVTPAYETQPTQRPALQTVVPVYETRPTQRPAPQTVTPAYQTRPPPPPPPRPATTQAPIVSKSGKTSLPKLFGTGFITDYASLYKFQDLLHGSVTHAPRTAPPSKTEAYTSTTSAPYTEYPDYQDYYQTTNRPTSRRPVPVAQESSNPFANFASLSKFQSEFHKSFSGSTPSPTTRQNSGSTASLDFNTRPRSETQAPEYPTTKRPSVFQSTFRTTFADITTLRPTFQQQPSRFNEDFFRKVESQNEFVKTDDEDDYQKAVKNLISRKVQSSKQTYNEPTQTSYGSTEYQDNYEGTSAYTTTSTTTTVRPVRRGGRRRLNTNRERNGEFDTDRKFSRRVQNARFEDKQTFASRERSQSNTEEIFDAEASVFRGPADINNFYNNEGRANQPGGNDETTSSEAKRPPTSAEAYGRRIRPGKLRKSQPQDSDDQRQNQEDKKPVKRLRQMPSSTTSTEIASTTTAAQPNLSLVSATTYRPPNKYIQVRTKIGGTVKTEAPKTTQKYVPTTTPEPELVTASDEERDQIRLFNENRRKSKTTLGAIKATTYKPTLLSLKITTKTNFSSVPLEAKKVEKPLKKDADREVTDSNSTRSPDYDYTYYDSDPESDYADIVTTKQDKYGKKSNKVIVAKS